MNLHLGCGVRNLPDFINIDLCDYPHIDYKSDIKDLKFIKSESVDYIYCSHAFEYFDREEANVALKEWNRVLKKDGLIRIAVPNFDALVELYKETENLDKILGPLYGKISIQSLEGKKTLYHKTVYNFESLKNLMLENNFYDIKHYDWKTTEHSDYDDHSQSYHPHMQKDTGKLLSLNIEACKK